MRNLINVVLLGLSMLTLAACGGGGNSTSSGSSTSTLPPAGIQFISATPRVIGVQGGGQAPSSTLTFQVTDSNNVPVADGIVVNLTMSGPNGGEFIGPADNTPTQASATTAGGNGQVPVTLTAGKYAGSVNVHAQVNGTAIGADTPTLSIGGGVPSASHMSISASKHNLNGLRVDGVTSTIQILLADRFGNYNILEGSSVSFYANAGSIKSSNNTDIAGATSVEFRTQDPRPPSFGSTAQEDAMVLALNTKYSVGIPTGTIPRNGWATILATVAGGEESFVDRNADGIYQQGETITSDLGEPYMDENGNGQYDLDEFFVNTSAGAAYSGANGVWDGPGCPTASCESSKTIWTSMRLMFTGDAVYCGISQTQVNDIANGDFREFTFMVGDSNLNPPIQGTTIAVTTTKGTLTGETSVTMLDSLVPGNGIGGPKEITFQLHNNNTPGAYTITVTVNGVQGMTGCTRTISGNLLP